MYFIIKNSLYFRNGLLNQAIQAQIDAFAKNEPGDYENGSFFGSLYKDALAVQVKVLFWKQCSVALLN